MNYETTIIVTPDLSMEDTKTLANTYVEFLKTNKAEIIHIDHWGLRQLAYPIRKKSTGSYFTVEFTATDGTAIDKLELNLRRDDRVLRFLTVKLDKYAVDYNQRKRQGLIGKQKQSETKPKTVGIDW